MYKVGELITYSTHGICHINNITSKTFNGETKDYYELHPLDNENLAISIPVNSDLARNLEIMEEKEARKVLHSFQEEGMEWIENHRLRQQTYTEITRKGNRLEIAKILCTLMSKQLEAEVNHKKLLAQDLKILLNLQNILYRELSHSLKIPKQSIIEMITGNIEANLKPV